MTKMTKLLSTLATVSMLGLSGAAVAAEPVTLDPAQLDAIAAGNSLNLGQGNAQVLPVLSPPVANIGIGCGAAAFCF